MNISCHVILGFLSRMMSALFYCIQLGACSSIMFIMEYARAFVVWCGSILDIGESFIRDEVLGPGGDFRMCHDLQQT